MIDYPACGRVRPSNELRKQGGMDVSRFRSDLETQLSGLSFECQGAFPSEG